MAIFHKGIQRPIMLRCQPSMSEQSNEWNRLLGEVDGCIQRLRNAYRAYMAYEKVQAQLLAENLREDFWEVVMPRCEEAYVPVDELVSECVTLWNQLNEKYFALLQGTYVTPLAATA
jgi:hypothetical protein